MTDTERAPAGRAGAPGNPRLFRFGVVAAAAESG